MWAYFLVVQFPVLFDSLSPKELQHARLLCPSLFPGVCSNSCPLMPSNHLIHCCPFLLLPSIFPSIRIFSSELAFCIRWPKCWSLKFSISPSNEYTGLISFRTNWFDLLAVQGTLRSLLQHHSSKASFFGTQLSLWSNSHRTTGKTIALTI